MEGGVKFLPSCPYFSAPTNINFLYPSPLEVAPLPLRDFFSLFYCILFLFKPSVFVNYMQKT